jgi:hypothetical protein
MNLNVMDPRVIALAVGSLAYKTITPLFPARSL